jgi:hypothetical protein
MTTGIHGRFKDVPVEDALIISISRRANGDKTKNGAASRAFLPGEHYQVLKERVPTRDANKIEVVEAFSYGCTNCYEMEGLLREWQRRQAGDVDFSMFHAVWNPAMALYARGYFACKEMDILGKVYSAGL